ncbi:MAG: cation:proton antiporter [Candidatus Hydrothermarchaeaceae archaeon]
MATAFIQDFAIVLLFAFVITLFFSRMKQPVVFGYLVTGILIGPYTLKLVSDINVINVFAELGIILLMYTMGLKFNIKKLRKVGVPAIVVGFFEIFLILAIGNTLGRMLGWSYIQSIFLGGVLAFSSTAVILKILMERKALRKEYSLLIFGILLIEDVGAIVMLTILGSFSMVGANILLDALMIIFKISVFFSVTLVFGLKFIPPFINEVRKASTREVLLLTSLGLCFALSAFSDYLGFSVALGAFMMGAIISESRYHREVEDLTEPVRDVFASMFFISIGMLVDPFILKDFVFEIIVISVIAVLVKLGVISLGLYLAGYTGLTSMSVGLGMIPRGEFSFIIAKLGVDQGVVGQEFYLITVAVALVTTLIGPLSLASSNKLAGFVEDKTPIPVKSFFKFSSDWIRTISGQFELDREAAAEFQKRVREIGINVLIIIIIYQAVLVTNSYALGTLSTIGAAVFGGMGLATPAWFRPGTIAVIVGGVVSLPSLYMITRNIRMLIDLSIGIASAKFKFLGVELVRNTLRNVMYVMTVLVFTITLLPIIISEVVGHGLILDSSVLILVALAGYFFWRTMRGFHHSLHEMITETLLAEEEPISEDIDSIIESLKVDRDFGLEKLEIKPDSVVIGQNITETKLKALTGVTVVAIERGSRTIRNPRPSEVIKRKDTLLVIGTEQERKNARKYLTTIESPGEEKDFSFEKLKIQQGSPAAGKTLEETRLRALTGVTLIAIERGWETLRNPKPQSVIKGGDILLVIGTRDEIEKAREYLL